MIAWKNTVFAYTLNRFYCNPGRSVEKAQEPQTPPKVMSPREEDEGAAEDEEQEEEEDSLMVPQVKVAEDGTLIIDEERSVDF